MANLRSLLDREYASTVNSTAALYGSLDRVRDGKVMNFMPHCNMGNCDDSYRRYYMQYWCVPCGTTSITWELWGGGGSGAGACCCQQGVPGGSGAYVSKTLHYPLIQGGWCYCLVVASPTCCSACCCGIQGCKSYITGCNLNNLCAEGGRPGKTCCYVFWGQDLRCQSRIDFRDCGGWDRVTDCSCGYGDHCEEAPLTIIPGRPGFVRTYNTSDNCWARHALPYPPKLIDDKGGFITPNNKGNACNNEGTYCSGNTPWAYSTNCNGGPGMPGVGSPSATSCGGGCCYGWRGGGGMIRVTMCSCWIGVNNSCAYWFCN